MVHRRLKQVSVLAVLTMLSLSLSFTGFVHPSPLAYAAATTGPGLAVDVSAGRHAISPFVYGTSTYAPQDAVKQELRFPIERWGGDGTTNYNWLQNDSNAGNDWYFMGGDGTTTPVPGKGADDMVTNDIATGGQSLITVPIIGYVDNSSLWNCSYPSSLYPNQQAWNPYKSLDNGDKCGNGHDANGATLADIDLSRNYISVDPTWMQQWIQHLVQTHGTAAANGVGYYQMDNEPELWPVVHFDVHPAATGFDEVVNSSTSYASMVKATDPTAQVIGPSDGYVYAYFHLGDKAGDNAQSHGMDWIPYYLQQMQAYQQSHGTRLLDYLDVHAYGAQSNSNDDPSSNASRLDSTRALWDPTYNGSTAIGQYFNPPQQIGLIPALKAWTNKYYPGTKTSISEYSYGNETNLNGALTQADVLGIYGREGLDMAEYWGNINPTDPIASAFRAYLNFDGHGAQYGDTSVHGTSADQGKLSIYSAQRSRDNALTLQVINKTGGDLTSTLALSHFAADSTAHVYSYSSSNLAGIVQQPDLAVSASGFTATYPANSITTIVIPQQGSPYVGGAAANAAPSTLNTLQADASSYALFAGQTYQTVATTIDSNGVGTIVTNSVAYTSDNTAVATVNSSGLVTATGAGTAHITGIYQGKSFTVTVTGVALQSIKLDAAYTLPQGAQHQTIVTAVNSDGSTVPVAITSATYTSSNSSIATVSSTGVVTALAAGTVKITAVYQGLSNSTTVTVPKSQPLPSGWLHLDIGAVAASGTVSYNSGTFNVSGSGADVWQAQDQEQFVYQPLSNNGTIIARMTSTSPVNTYAKGGLMLRDGLTAGSNLVYLAMFPTGGVQLGAGSGANASIQGYWSQDAGTATFPYWLRLDRNNDVVTASVSTDGTTWTQSPQQIAFPTGQAYVGLFSTDHGAPLLNTSIFDHVTVKKGSSAVPLPTGALPSGWKAVDLGPVGGPGHVGYQNKTFTLLATGQNIIGGSDSGYFVYHTLSGDGSITARVATQDNASNPYAEAGVMLRDGLQYGANVAFLGISPGAYTRMNVGSATATNGIANVWQCGCAYTAPYWLRIVRAGTTLTAFTSPDGLTWTQQTQQTFVAGPILIGLAEDAASNVVFNPATFDNVTLTATIFGARPQH